MMLDFFRAYCDARKQTPGLPEEQYHRLANQVLGRECAHPITLLRLGGPDGPNYLEVRIESVAPECRDARLTAGFFEAHKPELWCPVCQCFPWRPWKSEQERLDFLELCGILQETNHVENTTEIEL